MNMLLLEEANGFVLTYETWFRYLVLGFGSFFAVTALFAKMHRFRMLIIGSIGVFVGLYPLTFQARLTPEEGRVYAFIRYDTRVSWADVTSVELKRGYKGKWLIVAKTDDEPFELVVTGLPERQRRQLLRYIEERVAASSA